MHRVKRIVILILLSVLTGCNTTGMPGTTEKRDGDFTYYIRDPDRSFPGVSVSGRRNYSDTRLVIPAELDSMPVTSIWAGAFAGARNITELIIPESVLLIDDRAFEQCVELPSPVLPSSLKEIGDKAFRGCESLVSIVIPASVTKIGAEAFANCKKFTAFMVDENNPVYASVDGVLFDKSLQTLAAYPAGKSGAYTIPSSVTKIESQAFSECGKLTGLTLPNSLTEIGSRAFNRCFSIAEITIPPSVTAIADETFLGCTKLTGVTILSSITKIGVRAFDHCENIAKITIPPSVTEIGKAAFESCKKLAEITIPASVQIIGEYAFDECDSLAGIAIPASVTEIGVGAFADCGSLAAFTVDENNPVYASDNGILFDKSLRTLVAYPAGKSGAYTIPSSVTTIGEEAFNGCRNLTAVTIPDSVKAIKAYAFSWCENLTAVDIPDSITVIREGTFYECYRLAEVTIPPSVTEIERRAFYHSASEYALASADIQAESEYDPYTLAFINLRFSAAYDPVFLWLDLFDVNPPAGLGSGYDMGGGVGFVFAGESRDAERFLWDARFIETGLQAEYYIGLQPSTEFWQVRAFANYGKMRGVLFLGGQWYAGGAVLGAWNNGTFHFGISPAAGFGYSLWFIRFDCELRYDWYITHFDYSRLSFGVNVSLPVSLLFGL